MVFIESADRVPISPTFRELPRLVPQEFGGSAASPLHTLRGGSHPESPARPFGPSRAPPSSVSTRFGERGSLGGHRPHTSRKIFRPQDLLLPLPSSLLQQTLLSLAEVLEGSAWGEREQFLLAPFYCSLRNRTWAQGGAFEG